MDMIFVGVDGFELEIRIVFRDSLNPPQDKGLNTVIDDGASVFSRKDNMIVTEKDRVG